MEQNTVKRIPYGIQDFVQVIEQNSYYVDKTMYIPMLEEEPNNLFFFRPRRFGKSVFLSMLHAYYDCRTKDKFQQWFGDLWIGKHPTPLQGRYQVLHLDFSQVGGTIHDLEKNFDKYCRVKFDSFADLGDTEQGVQLRYGVLLSAQLYQPWRGTERDDRP